MAQQRLHGDVAARLQQQPPAVPSAQDGKGRRGGAEHRDALAVRGGPAEIAGGDVGGLGGVSGNDQRGQPADTAANAPAGAAPPRAP